MSFCQGPLGQSPLSDVFEYDGLNTDDEDMHEHDDE